MSENNTICIYSDGACRNNQSKENIGAIGVVLLYNEHTKTIKRAFRNTTNNRMEILACIEGLQALKRTDIPIEIYTDSQYVVNTMNCGWKMKTNTDLWNKLVELIHKMNSVKFIKVAGHSDNYYNNIADDLCNDAMNEYKGN